MIPKMLVLVNPHEKGDLAPTVRFTPDNGFSVRHGNIKGAWRDNINNAVEDFNGSVERALNRLRFEKFAPEVFDLSSCFGIGTAWADYEREQKRRIVEAESSKAHAAGKAWAPPSTPGCGCPVCDDKTRAPEYRAKRPGGGLLGLVAMLAALGALDGLEDDKEAGEPFMLDAMPEMAEALGKAGLLHRTGPNSAVVAIPRKMGEAFIVELEDAIRNNDLARVKRLTVGRNFG